MKVFHWADCIPYVKNVRNGMYVSSFLLMDKLQLTELMTINYPSSAYRTPFKNY